MAFKPLDLPAKGITTPANPVTERQATFMECAKCHIDSKETQFKIKYAASQPTAIRTRMIWPVCMAPIQTSAKRYREGQTVNLYVEAPIKTLATGREAVIAVPCALIVIKSRNAQILPKCVLSLKDLSCTPRRPLTTTISKRGMRERKRDGIPVGCEACHSTKTWKDVQRFDHSKTTLFPPAWALPQSDCLH